MTLTVGQRVRFRVGARKMIMRDELELEGLTGTVTYAGEHELAIRLDDHFDDLDEWDNELVWTLQEEGENLADVVKMAEVIA